MIVKEVREKRVWFLVQPGRGGPCKVESGIVRRVQSNGRVSVDGDTGPAAITITHALKPEHCFGSAAEAEASHRTRTLKMARDRVKSAKAQARSHRAYVRNQLAYFRKQERANVKGIAEAERALVRVKKAARK